MRRAIAHRPAGSWPAAEQSGSVTLPHAERHRRRFSLTDDDGAAFLLDLSRPAAMADGDGLELEGGGWLRVVAAPEELAEITCEDPEALARIAWHIGNRHMPVQVLRGGTLRLPADHVL
ncbi:MAG: Urease accessory protein UreE, partial [Alphaproteobacteria bacterium]|nr:Urease accessory protein UreE [Alphaproteobacteria bacterium]